MLKQITTIITANPKARARKAVVMIGVTLGIAIGLLLSKVEDDPDMVFIEKLVDEPDDDDASDASEVED